MFSRRLTWNTRPNALGLLLARKRAEGTPVCDLTVSNPTQAGFSYPEAEILSAFQNARALSYHPHPAGLLSAREHIAQSFGLNISDLILTSSTSEAYSWIFKLLCDPGDQILVPKPSYPLFEYLSALENVQVRHYPLLYAGAWHLDINSMLAQINSRTRAIVLVNPNNPTGSYVGKPELEALSSICREHELALISDEVFAPYALTPGHPFIPVASATDVMAFSLNGLSKLAGLPQMKLGWIQTNHREALHNLELIADTYLSVGAPVQFALPALLKAGEAVQPQILHRIRGNMAELKRRFRPRLTEGGWYAVLPIPRTRSEEDWVLHLLEHHNLLVQPGYYYDFEQEAFLVLSLLTPPAEFLRGLAILHTVLGQDYC